MKIQTKISLYFVVISIILFLIGSFISYYVIEAIILDEVDEALLTEEHEIYNSLKTNKTPEVYNSTIYSDITIGDVVQKAYRTFSDTSIYVSEEGETVLFRQLISVDNLRGKSYTITVRQSLLEQEDLATGITFTMIGILVSIIISFNLLGIWSERKLWSPFYNTLSKLEKFEIHKVTPLVLPESKLKEFDKLNKTLNELSSKIVKDYKNLKEFSENASHELQTPLSILRSKLDILIQDKSLNESQSVNFQTMYSAVNRLSKIINSLNIITKIDNEEFSKTEILVINNIINSQLEILDEVLATKDIRIEKEFSDTLEININKYMAETLVSNLLSNAIKHNIDSGFILIKTGSDFLEITNSGNALSTSPEEMFLRFRKESLTSDSTGLGLAIVKGICERYNLSVNYNYANHQHTLSITVIK